MVINENPALYDAAKQACHESGLPWTDPRTGVTHEPPVKEMAQCAQDHRGWVVYNANHEVVLISKYKKAAIDFRDKLNGLTKEKKISIRKNRYGNWYGYIGGKRVIAFTNITPGRGMEQAAKEWLAEQCKGFRPDPSRIVHLI